MSVVSPEVLRTIMSKEQFRIRRKLYWDRKGKLTNQETISEFSRTRSNKIFFDRSNAKYIVEENIREDVAFDLKLGCREFFEESDEDDETDGEKDVEDGDLKCAGERELNFSVFCKWACMQPQEKSLKEVFKGADIVSWRVDLRDVASAIVCHRQYRDDPSKMRQCSSLEEFIRPPSIGTPNKPWARIAMKAGDVIMFGIDKTGMFLDESDDEVDDEDEEETDEEEQKAVQEPERELTKGERIVIRLNEMRRDAYRQRYYSGYKFEQYMTSDEPKGRARPDKKIKKQLFETVMTSDLTEEGFDPIRLCTFSEVDALRGDEPIELKSTFKESFYSKLHTYLHCNFANMKTFVTGFRNEDFVTTRVIERRTSDLQAELCSNFHLQGETRADERSYSFLHDVLTMTKHILTRSKACRLVYLPKSGIIQFEGISVAEAEKRGHGFTEEFKKRFNIE